MNWMRRRETAGRSAALAVMALIVVQLLAAPVYALPSGAETIHGEAAFSVSDNTLTVSQATDQLIVNWEAFGIDAGERVVFDQPGATSIALNRVIGDDPSAVYGQLTANGRVFLLNPHGILFGAGARVDVGGLVASTLELHDDDFLSGTYRFTRSHPDSHGGIVNEGQLTSGEGGFIALLGTTVDNRGTIHTPQGSSVLAAGGEMTLSLDGDGLLSVVVDEAAVGAQVANGGLIVADGGRVFLTAEAKEALFETVVSHTGTIQARGMAERNGQIVLLGGTDGGTVVVDGTLDASAPDGGDGGFVETSGAHVQVADGARVTTAAPKGATGVWLIDPTDYVIADVDPADGSSYMSAGTLATNLASTHVAIETVDAGEGNGDIFINDSVSWDSANTLTLKAHRNIEINATVSNTNAGDLIVRADKEGTGIGTVTIGEGAAIDFSGSSGDVTIYYNPAGYNQDETKTVQDTNGVLLGPYNDRVTMGSGSFTSYMLVNSLEDLDNVRTEPSGVYALGHDIDASATGVKDSAFWNDGAGFMPIGDFRGIFNGNGHTIDRLYINRTDLWSVGLFASAGNGVWIKDVGLTNVDITGDGRVGALAGRLVSGFRVDRSYATGVVEGGTIVGGLAGAAGNGGTISESYAAVTVTGTGHRVGGLVGSMGYFASIFYSYATGNVTGSGYQVGGLLGYAVDYARIYTSYASGAVRAAGDVGGLVGFIDHTSSIHNSYWDVEKTGVSDAVGSGWVRDVDATGVGGEGRPDPLSEATYKSFEDAGLDFTAHFGIIDGISYPYLRWRFPQGPSVVSGTVSGVENGNDRLGVGLAVGGKLIGATTTGADGSYYMAVDPLNAGDAAIVWLDDADARGNTFSFVNNQGHGTGLEIFSDVVHVMTNVNTMSATSTNLMDAARGALPNENGRFLYSVSGGALEISPGISLNVWAPVGQFDIDQAISTSEGGSMTVEGESGNLTVSKNLHADGTVTLMAHSHLTISKGVTVTSAADGNAIVIAAEISFRNNSGSNALVLTGDGRWLVYSGVVSQNTYGGLDSGNTAVWNASYATRPPSTVNLPGNRYLFKQQPTLYFYLPTDLEKTYGEAIDPSTLHAAYSVSGFHEGREGAFLADTAATAFSGAPKWSSEGFAADANVDDYQVLIEAGNLYSEAGYDLEFSSGYIIVNPASITISATPITKTYDGTRNSNVMPTVTGTLFGDDDFSVLKQEFWSANAGTHSLMVDYRIDDGNDGFNYDVTVVGGEGTIIPASITIKATEHNRIYDGTPDSNEKPEVTAGQLFFGDLLYAKQEFDSKHAGARILKVTEYLIDDGNGGNNYEVTLVDGSGTISKAPLTITAIADNRIYDGTTDSNGVPIVTGTVFAGDTLSGLTQAFDAKHAGERTLIVTGYTISDGNGGNNYEVTLVEGNGTINPKALTVGLIGTVHKTYDGTTHAALTTDNYDLIGALTTDEVELSAPGFGTYDTENAGENKTVSVSGLDLVGRDAANYVLDQDSVSAAIGVITRAELVVRALDFAKLAGEKNPAFDVSYEGFVAGDTAEGLAGDLSFATDAATDSPPGRYAITPFGLSAPNYTITYEPGTLTIAATPIVSGAPEDAYEMAVWYAQTVLQTDLETDEADEDDVLELLE